MTASDLRDVVIALDDLSFTYAGGSQPALRHVSLRIQRGELVVVMGATGAGKSTLAKCLNRTVPEFQPGAMSGRVRVLDRDLDGHTVADLAGTVGLVLQDFEAQLFATDVQQEMAFGLEQLGVDPAEMSARIHAALAVAGLQGFEHRDPTTLSGGEKQRLAIAAVLAMQPPIIVFDEPTTDLDPVGKRDVFRALGALRQRGHTMVLIEHEIDAADGADRLVLLSDGAVVADGPPAPILRDVGLLQRHGVRPRDVDRLVVSLALPAAVTTIDGVEQTLRTAQRTPRPHDHATAAAEGAVFLDVQSVTFAYADGSPVLTDVNLRIHEGEFVALIGQNGSGKTTLARLLNGLLQPRRGRVQLRGDDIGRLPLSQVAALVGYVFQDPDQQIFAASVRDEVSFGPRNLGVAAADIDTRVGEVLAAVNLTGVEDVDPFLLGKGQRQRLAVAALLAQRPRLLILDEPTTGLDYNEQKRMMDLVARLHQQGITLVVITHSPWVVAEYAQRGVLLAGGQVVFDGPLRALFTHEDLLERSHFRVPAVAGLGNRFGASTLSVEEFVAATAAGARAL